MLACEVKWAIGSITMNKVSACNVGGLGSTLGWEDTLEKEMATHSSILACKIHGRRRLVAYSPWGCKESDMTEQLHFFFTSVEVMEFQLSYFKS